MYGMPKFHMAAEKTYLSAFLKSAMAASIRFHTRASAAEWAFPCRILYLAATSPAPNSGTMPLKTSTVRTVSPGWASR